MKLSQMFPSRTLDAEDLEAFAPGVTIVTIENVAFRTMEATKPGDAEIEYSIKFREFRKMVRLSKTRAQTIADVLGTDETDEWVGKTVGISPAKISIYDRDSKRNKLLTIVSIDIQRPMSPPTLAPNTDITGAASQARLNARAVPGASLPPTAGAAPAMLGMEQASLILAALKERNKTWDDLLVYLRSLGMGEAVAGRMPFDCPAAVLAPARAFVRGFPRVKDVDVQAEAGRIRAGWAPPAATEVIDKATGEVITLPGPDAGTNDDIPF